MSTLILYLKKQKNPEFARRRAPACLMSSEGNPTTGATHTRLGRTCHRWDWEREIGRHEVTAILKYLRGRIAVAEMDPEMLAGLGEDVPEGVQVRPIQT